jgi:hypothetical protein
MNKILAVLLLLVGCCNGPSKVTKNDILTVDKIDYGEILSVQFDPGSAFGFRAGKTMICTKTKNIVLWDVHYDILLGKKISVTTNEYLYEGDRWDSRKYAIIDNSIYPMDKPRSVGFCK